MKTAISVEDSLLEQADSVARDLGLSRSGLISAALREYLQRLHYRQVLEKLNRAYADHPDQDEQKLLKKFKTRFRPQDRW